MANNTLPSHRARTSSRSHWRNRKDMLTRRDILARAVAAGAAFAKASQPSTPVNFDIPPHACDCHTHIFGDPAKYPLWPGRGYTPEPATPAEMAALHRALH